MFKHLSVLNTRPVLSVRGRAIFGLTNGKQGECSGNLLENSQSKIENSDAKMAHFTFHFPFQGRIIAILL